MARKGGSKRGSAARHNYDGTVTLATNVNATNARGSGAQRRSPMAMTNPSNGGAYVQKDNRFKPVAKDGQ